MVIGSSRPVQAGITPPRELVMTSMIVASSEPNSQMPSVRFGAPSSLLPLPSAP